MKFKSESGYSLIEIGVALIIIVIFMVCSVTLLSASNENYHRIEQRNIALSYAMQAIEAIELENRGLSLADIKNKALIENNMRVETTIETIPPKDGINYGSKVLIITANVKYNTMSKKAGSEAVMTLQTLMINE